MTFSPYPRDASTRFSIERYLLMKAVSSADEAQLRADFLKQIQTLPGAKIESHSDSIMDNNFMIFEARFTFLDGSTRRERWVKTVYQGNSRANLTAQGRDTRDFAYWLPLFSNIMLNAAITPNNF